jgi:hypothetical protein
MSAERVVVKASCAAANVMLLAIRPTITAAIGPEPAWWPASAALRPTNYVALPDMWRARENRFCGVR